MLEEICHLAVFLNVVAKLANNVLERFRGTSAFIIEVAKLEKA